MKTKVSDLHWEDIVSHYGYRGGDRNTTRVTRRGLRRLLVLIRRYELSSEPVWYQLWQANVWAYREALRAWHVRLPARWSAHDRARVAWLLRGRGAAITNPEQGALRWANQRSTS